ncbi:MAG: hypothetical protein M0Z87_11385 [Actinomycetota bacterium]|nr:hypothetical protein [Actinomycetota bacterium]
MRSVSQRIEALPVDDGPRPGGFVPPGLRFGSFVALMGIAGGWVAALAFLPGLTSRMLPWIVGRALGIAAYTDLVLLVAVGTWFRHPWRLRHTVLHPQTQLRLHAGLSAGAIALVAGHVAALVADSYAKVGLLGAFVPGASGYRPLAVAVGVVALYAGLAVGLGAALSGRTGWGWLGVHRLGAAVLAFAWLHGVLAGTDTIALRWFYVLTGALLTALVASRHAAVPPQEKLRQ